MESEMSVIDIGEADDSLLEEEEEICKTGTLDLGCSPLHFPLPPNANANANHVSRNLLKNESNLDALNSTTDQMKKRKKRGGGSFNLRKSLAWNNAFFTEEGFLNQQELSRLSYGAGRSLTTTKLNKDDSLPDILDQESIGGLNDLHGNFLFHTSPLKRPTINTTDPKSSRKLELPKGVNKSHLQAGGCPRPRSKPHLASAASSQKRLPSMDMRNASTKDLKETPKLSLLKSEPSLASTTPKIAALGSKHSSCNRNTPQGNLEKDAFAKGSSTTSGTTPLCIASRTRYSVHLSGNYMASKATAGLKVIPDPERTFDARSSKVVIPSQNADHSGEKFASAQIHATKPSGLRMPSPSLRYFSQASTSIIANSPKTTQSRIFREISIPGSRKFGDSCHAGETEPSHKPAGTARMPERGTNATKCPIPSAATMISHPSVKLNKEFNRSVMNTLQRLPHVNSETERHGVGGADNLIEHQHGEEAHKLLKSNMLVDMGNGKAVDLEVPESEEHKQRISHEIEKVQQENIIPQENSVRFVEQRTSEEHIKDNGFGDSRGNESKNNILSKDNGELKWKLENAVRGGSINKLQKDNHIENSIDVDPEIEECNTGELQISQVPPLFDSEIKTSGVFGTFFPYEQKNSKDIKESSKGSTAPDNIHILKPLPSLKFEYESVVHDDCFEIGYDDSLLGEQEELKETILDQVENVEHKEYHNTLKNNCGLVEQNNSLEISLGDNDHVILRGKGSKNNNTSKHTETNDSSHSKVSNAEEKRESKNSELPVEDKCARIPVKQKSLDDSRQVALSLKHNAAPFSDEWLAALEEVGEDILTRKTGAVQNSPPDKSLPEPGPWSPVKRMNIPEIGPFDCTKYTTLQLPQLE